jgi:hypothetical protein
MKGNISAMVTATKLKPAIVTDGGSDRQKLLQQAETLHLQAEVLAAKGELLEAGLLILKGLDCERRAKARGPQVLGLIKKRE